MNNTALVLRDLQKYVNYFFETKGFTTDHEIRDVSDRARQAAKSVRGMEREPAIMIHGVMPRCGSVYVGELLRLHPAVYAYPGQFWEFPALELTRDVRELQQKFLLSYKPNADKLGDDDFLPLFGAGLVAYLHESVPAQQRLLMKMPSAQYLAHFYSMFPHENLLILVRDGRDLVHSTLRTWPRLNFVQVCLRWNRSVRMIVRTVKQLEASNRTGWWLARYEDALEAPCNFVHEACNHFGLDETCYPYERIDEIRVIGSSKLERPQGEVTWRWHKRPENFKPTEYWRQWSPIRKLLFKVIAGQSLIDLGYCEDQSW